MKASLTMFTCKTVGSGIALVLVLSALLGMVVRARTWNSPGDMDDDLGERRMSGSAMQIKELP